MNPGGWSAGDWARGAGPSEDRLHLPQSPDRAGQRNTGSGSPAAQGFTPTGPGPSGRHAFGYDVREYLDDVARDYITLRTAKAIRAYDRGDRATPGRHAAKCPCAETADHRCAFETRMVGTVLVRRSGAEVGGDAR